MTTKEIALLQPENTGLNKSLDSLYELYMLWYLRELEEAGYISAIAMPNSMEIISAAKVDITQKLKTKDKVVQRTLLASVDYTPDFSFFVMNDHPKLFIDLWEPVLDLNNWNSAAFKSCNNEVLIDVKAANYGGKFGSTGRSFQINRSILWQSESRFVNKIIPINKGVSTSLFRDTFVPNRFLYTDISGKRRTINFPIRTLKQYLDGK